MPNLKLDNIQGNVLAGFNKDFQSFLFVSFPAGSDAKGWLAALAPDIATTAEVSAFNELFKAINARRGDELGTVQATWLNVALSASGLAALGVPQPELETFSSSFRAGMAAQAAVIGDEGANAPAHWVEPLGSTEVHALLLLASDDPADLDAAALREIDRLGEHDLRLLFKQDGRARSDLPGHEHFGFKDGVSQPGIREFTQPANPADPNQGQPGQDLLWPGEFVLGYPAQQRPPQPPAPLPGPPNYGGGEASPAISVSDVPTEPGPVSTGGPEWAVDGSYLVFRRLQQDVAGFSEFVSQSSGAQNISAELMGAKLVGRYKSGCPLERTADESGDLDPQIADPSIADPSLLSDAKINNFEYGADVDGAIVPRGAHIRKVYPRDEATPGGGEADTQTHRLLRRGIAYGEPYDPGAPTGSPQAGDVQFPHDRGLLFLCYQSSLEDQFEFVQRLWVNNPNFPQSGDGADPIIAQLAEPRAVRVPGLGQPELSIPQFVRTTGGEYFFSPSISALQRLGGV
ncbi:MAG: Dyp-type peroxidase [Solirubrobacteraceae bacterium]